MTHAELVARILKYRGLNDQNSGDGQNSGDRQNSCNQIIENVHPIRIRTLNEFLYLFQEQHGEEILNYKKNLDKEIFSTFVVLVSLYKTYSDFFPQELLSQIQAMVCQGEKDKFYNVYNMFKEKSVRDQDPLVSFISFCNELGLSTNFFDTKGADSYVPFESNIGVENTSSMSIEEKNLLQKWIDNGKIDQIIPLLVTHEELAAAVKDRLSSIIRKG